MDTMQKTMAWAWSGAWRGVLAGGGLASLYAGLVTVGFIALDLLSEPSTPLAEVGNFLLAMAVYGGGFGVLPAMLIGGLTGGVVGVLLFTFPWLRGRAGLFGRAFCLSLAVLANVLVWREWGAGSLGWVAFWVGVPSVVYVAAGGWMAERLADSRRAQPVTAERPPA